MKKTKELVIEATPPQTRLEKIEAARQEVALLSFDIYQTRVSLLATERRRNHLEDRTQRVKFWRRRNADRDLRRLQRLGQGIQERSERLQSLNQQLEQLIEIANKL